jgi:hypothetical protein
MLASMTAIEMSAARAGRPWYRHLLDRWPTVLAVLATWGGVGGNVPELAQVLPYLPLLYLIVAKTGRRAYTWPILVIALVAITAFRVTGVVEPMVVAVGVALFVLAWAVIDGDLRESRVFQIQTAGLFLFGAVAVAALFAAPEIALYLVAAGWFFHGVWDFVHWYRDAVVARSFAEWCGVVDVMIAASLVFGY